MSTNSDDVRVPIQTNEKKSIEPKTTKVKKIQHVVKKKKVEVTRGQQIACVWVLLAFVALIWVLGTSSNETSNSNAIGPITSKTLQILVDRKNEERQIYVHIDEREKENDVKSFLSNCNLEKYADKVEATGITMSEMLKLISFDDVSSRFGDASDIGMNKLELLRLHQAIKITREFIENGPKRR